MYTNAGNYTVTATMTTISGNSVSVSTSVTVVPTGLPTVLVTVQSISPPSGHPATVTFQIQVTPPSGVSIVQATINWGGTEGSQDLGGVNGTISVTHTYNQAGAYVVTLTVTDSLGRHTSGTTSVTIS